MQKKTLIGVGVLVLVILAGGVFVMQKNEIALFDQVKNQDQNNYVQNSSDQEAVINTTNWKIYKDKSGLFLIKYPANLNYEFNNDGMVLFKEIGKKYTSEGDEAPYEIGISLIDDKFPERLSANDFVKLNQKYNSKIKELRIDGMKAIQSEDYLGIETLIYYNEEKNYYIHISSPGSGDADRNKIIRDVYIGMLQSFKFTN